MRMHSVAAVPGVRAQHVNPYQRTDALRSSGVLIIPIAKSVHRTCTVMI